MFKELEQEREKINQLSLSKEEDNSEIASLKLLMEEAENQKKKDICCKDKEIKSLKSELCRLETSQAEIAENCRKSEEEITDIRYKLGEKEKDNRTLVSKISWLETEIEQAKTELVRQTAPSIETSESLANITQEKILLEKELTATKETNTKLNSVIGDEKKKYNDVYLKWESSKAELFALKQKMELIQLTGQDAGEGNIVSGPAAKYNAHTQVTAPVVSVEMVHEDENICFTEFFGKCPRGSTSCKFSHDITPEMRANSELVAKITSIKQEKAAKCVNEFMKKGSCRKKESCRFSHNISDEHRNDPSFSAGMSRRYQQVTGRSYQGERNYNNHSYSEASGLSPSPWNPGNAANSSPIVHRQQHEQHTYNIPQPLMSIQTTPPVSPPEPRLSQTIPFNNTEAVKLFNSFLSHLLANQTSGHLAPLIHCP